MSEKKNGSKAAEVVAAEAEAVDDGAAVQKPETTAVALSEGNVPAGNGLGSFSSFGPAVLDWTWIHLKFEMSKKRPDGNQGEFFLGREWEVKLCDKGGKIGAGELPKPNQRFEFVIVGRRDGYKHYLTQTEFNAGVKAARYPVDPALKAKGWEAARAAALKAGETIGNDAWRDGDPAKGEPRRVGPSASEYMQLLVLVRKPADCEDETLFSIPLNGEFYAPAYLEFDKLNWRRAYGTLETVINGERNKWRVNHAYQPRIYDKVFWGYSSAIERPGFNGAPAKVITTPMMCRAVEDGKPVVLPEAALEDLKSIVSGAASSAAADDDCPF